MIHRHRNYIFEQLADMRLTASLIVDGHHLPASLVRTFVKVKSPKQIILTCDAAGWAGCPPGVYESKLGRSEILEDGKLVVAGQRGELLAGSAQQTYLMRGERHGIRRCLVEGRQWTWLEEAGNKLLGDEVCRAATWVL